MTPRSLVLAGLLSGAALAIAPTAHAASVTWDFADLANTTESVSGSGYGNTRTFTSGGLSVRVSAWSRKTNGNEWFEDAQLGRWNGYGLGVCSHGGGEGTNCDAPDHQVDNASRFDFVLFEFLNGTVDPNAVSIETYNNADLDVSYFVGTGTLPIDLSKLTEAQLADIGFGAREDDNYSGSADSRTVGIDGSTAATAVLFGASESQTYLSDYFKITALSASVNAPSPSPSPNPSPSAVSEPASLGLFGTGLACIAGLQAFRRRRAVRTAV